jgi:hypothetical protein
MATPTEMMSALEDQVLETVRQSQDAVVKAVQTWAEAGKSLVPDLPAMPFAMPFADQIPAAADVIETAFDFADKMLSVQREFAAAVLEAAKPVLGTAKEAAVKATTTSKAAAAKIA